MRFSQKTAIITGGADGIGRATASLMAGEGATVAVADIACGEPQTDASNERGGGGQIIGIAADVLDEQAVLDMVERALAALGRIDILVNAVGGSTYMSNPNACLDDMPAQDWERTININLRSAFLCTRAVIPAMKRARYGRIVNLSSIVARGDSQNSNVAYAAAKAGIRAFTRKLAIELGPHGITCNATAPGITATARIRKLISTRPPESIQAQIDRIPLRRMATAEDQAKVIAFLASDDAGFVSGQTIEVTGGE